ncbi:hypothetical protein F5B18DRAFT_664119 [Nemania serpens]|nr:hypothetical protein F5B18DRAFT_664119 [Nemania serpens]
MEEAAQSIKTLADQILPKQPYYLSLSHTSRYPIPAEEKILDEKYIRPLQYLTFVSGEADRGVLNTRAYFDVREEPNSSTNAPMPTTLKIDPNKPRKKVSLKDYKNKKVEGDSPPKGEKGKDTPNGLSTIKETEEFKKPTEPAPREMDNRRDAKKPIANVKIDATRRPSPSPERRKRVAEVDEGPKPVKRIRLEDATVNGTAPRPVKNPSSQKPMRNVPLGKSEAKDGRPSIAINGRPASSNSALRGASPKFTPQTNGHGKANGSQATHRRTVSNGEAVFKAVPKLLSPLHISDLSVDKPSDILKGSTMEARSSPRKRPAEASNSKAPPKKLRDESEPLPSTKKRKVVVPPLLSPTLPAIVMSELAKRKKSATPSKEVNLKSGQASDSSAIVKKPAKSMREDTIHVDSKREEPKQQIAAATKEEPIQPVAIIKEERKSYVVVIKYNKRRCGKTIERLLNLPAGAKRQTDGSKREDGRPRESSGSVEPGTARKRPRTMADGGEASKRPRTSEALRPSTPPRQATAMSRIASNSSQAGTPGAANGLTPSAQFSTDKRREPIQPDKLQRAQRLHSGHKFFMDLGTKLKHERDAIMKNKTIQEREHQTAVAAGIQSLLMYMHAVKLQSDALDLERLPRRPQSWREVLPLFRVVRSDCGRNSHLLALLLRLQGICTSYVGRALWFLPNEADALLSTSKEEADIWRSANYARKKLGVYDGSSNPSDGGVVGKLIDRLGPWTTPEEVIPITLEVMRNVIHINGPWKPNEELAKLGRSISNGMAG